MKYDPEKSERPLPHSPFKALTVPRPIGWISTIDENGIDNLAPFSQWQNLTFDPPLVMFAANSYPDGRRKDTVINAERTGWFVWNMATWNLREAVNASAQVLPPDLSEFDTAGVSRMQSDLSPTPMVHESPFHYECKYISTLRFPGNSPVGSVDVIFGKVERIHLDDSFITADGRVDIRRAKPIARLGYFDYTVVTDTFEMRVPGNDAAAEAALGGDAD